MVTSSDQGGWSYDRKAPRSPAGEFKARCLKLMDEVRATRRPVVITKRGRPVAKLVPVEEEMPSLYGRLKGTVTIHGDIISPIDVDWHAERGILYIGEDDDRG